MAEVLFNNSTRIEVTFKDWNGDAIPFTSLVSPKISVEDRDGTEIDSKDLIQKDTNIGYATLAITAANGYDKDKTYYLYATATYSTYPASGMVTLEVRSKW